MNRRRFLRSTGALALAAAAGCVGGRPDQPGDGEDGEPTPDGTPTGTPTPDGTPTEPPTSFTLTSIGCGAEVNRAEVRVEAGTVVVEGTTWGSEACYAARLASATLEADTLTIRVETYRTADPDEACAQCIAEIGYRATAEVPATPASVVVVHDGETVTETQL